MDGAPLLHARGCMQVQEQSARQGATTGGKQRLRPHKTHQISPRRAALFAAQDADEGADSRRTCCHVSQPIEASLVIKPSLCGRLARSVDLPANRESYSSLGTLPAAPPPLHSDSRLSRSARKLAFAEPSHASPSAFEIIKYYEAMSRLKARIVASHGPARQQR
jgi:hypothetical protein